MTPLSPRIDILPDSQRAVWKGLGFTREDFTLYGGTALAVRLGHRVSVDFDFFRFDEFDPAAFRKGQPALAAAEVLQMETNALTVLVVAQGAPVKLSFFGGLTFRQLEPPQPTEDGILRVASLPDLFATKLNVIYQRAEPKDYIDIDAILRNGYTLAEGIDFALRVYGPDFNAMLPLQALCYFEEPALHDLPESMRRSLTQAVRAVR
ncbi:MAG: nucleotidyl transferase AbiEii/AbiGii toxin family protein [Verrucomicrobiae bacterium]|nr:nucleotidyl transferase AbiEii/AbiGii toxin family protein [Verrucomicrobiae bacterium]